MLEQLEDRILNALSYAEMALSEPSAQAPSSNFGVLASAEPAAASFSLMGPSTTNSQSAQFYVSSSSTSSISGLKYTWSVVSVPLGAKVTFATNGNSSANVNNLTFSKCGSYTLRVVIEGVGITARSVIKDFTINPKLTSIALFDAFGKLLPPASELSVNSRNYSFSIRGLDQFGNTMTASPSVTWSALSLPTNGSFDVAASGSTLTASFNKAGQYRLVALSNSLPTKTVTFNVVPAITFITASEPSGATVRTQSPLEIASSTYRATAFAIDQFGDRLARQPTINWSASAVSTGGAVKTSVESNSALFQFAKSGKYTLKAQYGGVQLAILANVVVPSKVLTSLKVSQSAVSIQAGKSVNLSVQALDQFESPLTTQPVFTWNVTGGNLTSGSNTNSVTFVAGNQAGNYQITVRTGSLSKLVPVQILQTNPILEPIQTPALANLVRDLYQDNQLSRIDVISILRSTTTDGVVDASEYGDLKTIFATTSNYVMPSYVSTLARDVVESNPANQWFQGSRLGNLRDGSSASVMNRLIDKWFLGADVPAVTNPSFSYSFASGQLFGVTPSHLESRQGALGDCYLIAAFGALADSNPDAVRNMFIDNGDGTYTVRFYATLGDGQMAGTADYVTVNRQLPVDSRGLLVYANASAHANDQSISLWVALAEKGYAQWNETGKEGRDGTNSYGAITGGNSYYVFNQVLGYESSNYSFTDNNKQILINALKARQAVVLGTNVTVSTPGLVECHGYVITGYNSANDTFSIYNPWGYAHPTPLTWAQLKKDCGGFTRIDPSYTISTCLLLKM